MSVMMLQKDLSTVADSSLQATITDLQNALRIDQKKNIVYLTKTGDAVLGKIAKLAAKRAFTTGVAEVAGVTSNELFEKAKSAATREGCYVLNLEDGRRVIIGTIDSFGASVLSSRTGLLASAAQTPS